MHHSQRPLYIYIYFACTRYRKVGGDVCEGGSEVIYASTDTACCSNSKHA